MPKQVMLGTPAYDGRVDVGYTYSLVQSIQACADKGIALHPVWWPGEALVQHARNMLVKMALEANVEALLFADADQEWAPEEALALLSHPVDVVGAPVRKKTDDKELYNVRSKTPFMPVDKQSGLWIVDGIGTGFLKLSRKALVDLWKQSEPYDHNGVSVRMVFDVGVVDGRLMGEDTYMCEKLTALGYRIHLDPRFVVTHNGTKKFKGDFRAYIARLQAAEKAKAHAQ